MNSLYELDNCILKKKKKKKKKKKEKISPEEMERLKYFYIYGIRHFSNPVGFPREK